MAGLWDADFDTLEAEVYEAALIPERWPDVLDRLADISGAVGATLWSRRDSALAWIASPAIHELMMRFVSEGWAERNIRLDTAIERGYDHEPRFVTEADLFDDDSFMQAPLLADFLIPAGRGWSAATAITLPDSELLVLSVERAWAAGPIPAEAVATLDRLRPHLARSAMIASRLAFEQTKTAVEALAQLGFAAAAVGKDGRVALTNALFEACGTGWKIAVGDRLVLEDERANALVADALLRMDTPGGIRSIPMRRAGGRKVEAVMHLIPLRGAARDLFARAGAMLMIARATGDGAGPSLIQTLFDLTPSEALIARRLSAGQTVEEIAIATEKSVLTIRTQLKSVLGKTGMRRQSELVQMLARLLPPAL